MTIELSTWKGCEAETTPRPEPRQPEEEDYDHGLITELGPGGFTNGIPNGRFSTVDSPQAVYLQRFNGEFLTVESGHALSLNVAAFSPPAREEVLQMAASKYAANPRRALPPVISDRRLSLEGCCSAVWVSGTNHRLGMLAAIPLK